MANNSKKFQMMVRGNSAVSGQGIYEKDVVDLIKSIELTKYKHQIFLNSLDRIEDKNLKEKCNDLKTHYRLFKNDESYIQVSELSHQEKEQLNGCIEQCLDQECAIIIGEKESIPKELIKLIELETEMPEIIKNKLDIFMSLLSKYEHNKNEIKKSIIKLQKSSNINLTEAKHLCKQVDILNSNSNTFSNEENLMNLLEKSLESKKNEYDEALLELERFKIQEEKYKSVDGPEFRALVKSYSQTIEIIKMKTDMLNKSE
ncbi:uncharacterized protein LOC126900640 isoform X2 [Daktulosphaira vitifoliae]|uniref:uncharacterized protein LOC126900640 isoform X2 n=1 Tax=Daktulosphaira vitifoliae TaxID=58002 RepID=UPI0021AAE720|nr:uncharacterized protein LOC126900640 isoform X2 [Daktulosphaira vitifoliae]